MKTNFPKQSCFPWLPFPQWFCWQPVPAIRNRSSADKTPKSSQVTSSSKAKKHPVKIAVRLANLVLRSRNLRVQRRSLQRKVVKRLLSQVRVVVRLSHHLQRVHQFLGSQSQAPKSSNESQSSASQSHVPKSSSDAKLQVANLAAKLNLKRTQEPPWIWMWVL